VNPSSQWVFPSTRRPISDPAIRRALGPLAVLSDDQATTDIFVTSDGRVFADRGSATVMAIAMTAAGLVLCGVVILVGQLLLSVRTIQSLADLAALAASDVSMGVVSGRPCDAARAVAQRQGNYSVYCLMNGPEASVTISAEHSGITLSRTATAGPSVHGVWSGDESTP